MASASRGNGIGGKLVRDSLDKARSLGFRIMQFNAVVASNTYARRLYEGLGFVQLGVMAIVFFVALVYYKRKYSV